jgi:hypothetical protein
LNLRLLEERFQIRRLGAGHRLVTADPIARVFSVFERVPVFGLSMATS